MARKKHLINVHTGTGTTEPSGAYLYLGEIAVQHTPTDPALWIKTGTDETSTTYEKFIGETKILEIISGATDIAPLSAAVISLSAGVKSNEYVTALALNELDRRIDEISGNTGGGGGADIAPLSSATYTHVNDNTIHVTAQDKTTWGGKQDAIADLADIRNGSLSGASAYTDIVTLSAVTTAINDTLSAHTNTPGLHLPEVDSTDEGKVLRVVDEAWCASTSSTIYAGTADPSSSLGQNGDVYMQSNPVVIYETDGTTGLLGHNQNTVEGQWQLENLDLSAYKYLRCYFAGGTASGDATTPAVIVEIPLDTAAIGPSGYLGSVMTTLPFNRNREYLVSCAVDSTKTKFQVIHQNTLWDITASDANNNGRYLYKIEGYV